MTAEEQAGGGIIGANPDTYQDRDGWLEHRNWFTTNPCLYRAGLMIRPWPNPPGSEAVFSQALRAEGLTFGYWGSRSDTPWCDHIGATRAGTGY